MMFDFRQTRRSDAALVVLVAEGDERAFAEILKRHQDAVYGFALRMLNDPQEAEDAAQETFLRFFRAAGRYSNEASLRTYLLKILKNFCIDLYRKKRPELMEYLPELKDASTPLDLLEKALTVERLEKTISCLPVNQRTAVLLRHTEQMSYSEIAEVMDLSLGAVESLLVRGRRTLRQALIKDTVDGEINRKHKH